MSKSSKTVIAKPVAKKAAAKPAAKAAKPAAEKKVVAKAAPKAEEKKPAAKKAAAPKAAAKPAAKAAKPAAEKKVVAKAAPKAAAKKAAPAKKIAVVLTTPTAYELASKVTVAGSFNEWNQGTAVACKKDKKTGLWSAKLSLVAGTYQYKFICDDQYWDEGDNKVVEVK